MKKNLIKLMSVGAVMAFAISCASTKKFETPTSPDYLGLDQYPTADNSRTVANAGAAAVDAVVVLRSLGAALGKGSSARGGMEALNALNAAGVFSRVAGFSGKSKITVDMWKNAVTTGAYKDALSAVLQAHQSGKLAKVAGFDSTNWAQLKPLAEAIASGTTKVSFIQNQVAAMSQSQKDYFLKRARDAKGVFEKYSSTDEGKKFLAEVGVTKENYATYATALVRAEILLANRLIQEEGVLDNLDKTKLMADPAHYQNCVSAISTVPSAAKMMIHFNQALDTLYRAWKDGRVMAASPGATACAFASAMKTAYNKAYGTDLSLKEAGQRTAELGKSCGMVGANEIFLSALDEILRDNAKVSNLNRAVAGGNAASACAKL